MKIKVLRNLGAGLPSLKEGQTADVDDQTGKTLCKRGLALDLSPPQAKAAKAREPEPEAVSTVSEIHAVPEPPADLSAVLPQIGKSSVSKSKPAKADK